MFASSGREGRTVFPTLLGPYVLLISNYNDIEKNTTFISSFLCLYSQVSFYFNFFAIFEVLTSAEVSRLLVCDAVSLGRVLPYILKDQSAFLFRAKLSKKNEYLFFKCWPIRFSETSLTTRQTTHRHMLKDESFLSFVFAPFFLFFY